MPTRRWWRCSSPATARRTGRTCGATAPRCLIRRGRRCSTSPRAAPGGMSKCSSGGADPLPRQRLAAGRQLDRTSLPPNRSRASHLALRRQPARRTARGHHEPVKTGVPHAYATEAGSARHLSRRGRGHAPQISCARAGRTNQKGPPRRALSQEHFAEGLSGRGASADQLAQASRSP